MGSVATQISGEHMKIVDENREHLKKKKHTKLCSSVAVPVLLYVMMKLINHNFLEGHS